MPSDPLAAPQHRASKRVALAQADRVVVLVDGEVAAAGPWSDLAPRWSHLTG
jgi:ATP-binding cassette, subfamily B, bacterial